MISDIVPADADHSSCLTSGKWSELFGLVKQRLPPNSHVCDIGTRYGGLVHQFRKAGYDGWGVEYNFDAVRVASSLGVDSVHPGSISDIPTLAMKLGHRSVDAFLMDDVLEHLVHPATDLQTLASVQRPGGLVVARQMNWRSLGRRLFGSRWYYLQPAAHMYFFDPDSAARLFDKCGYDIDSVHFPGWQAQVRVAKAAVIRSVKTAMGRHLKPWTVGGRSMYLDRRKKMSDMFTVIARRK